MLHCHNGKADCRDVLYIFSARISVSHDGMGKRCMSHCVFADLLRDVEFSNIRLERLNFYAN